MAQPSVITAVAIKEKTPSPPIDRKEVGACLQQNVVCEK